MKYFFSLSMLSFLLFTTLSSCAQNDKSKRPSPPATVSQKIGKSTVTINYSKPSVKGRTIGVDLEPKENQVWRAGANEATVFEVDNDVMIESKLLPKGKYGFFVLATEETWTVIFNKSWNQWGAMGYKEADDVLRVPVPVGKAAVFAEQLTYAVNTDGIFSLSWGDKEIKLSMQEKQ